MTHDVVPSIFSVTYEDIDRGVPDSPSSCPLARCMRRAGFKRIVVDTRFISAWHGSLKLFALPDKDTRDRITAFDAGKCLRPFIASLDFQKELKR